MTGAYAALTRNDPSALKRWVQDRRLVDADRLAGQGDLGPVLDYGCGDGALAARLLLAGRTDQAVAFEPAPTLRAEAEALLDGVAGARVAARSTDLADGWARTAFCLEVFEHLPPRETETALAELHRILAPGGRVVIGVPIEVGPPALAKGIFRMIRRASAFDARPGPILAAALGRPPREREESPIGPGLAYYPHHLGFDHRAFFKQVGAWFQVERIVGSPLGGPLAVNSEAYLVARKGEAA
ncbi:class I SAM-dependent methyltransferase [Caulobacter hibisci]|uniref:Methyltransferase domain-containing protein n=1 Tax=Caulobacter hibisci TaxID=2035993 RepID=A0ABS0T2L3_9CAUL|nr:methyltransferase domain-containing protein [Caulobacter hibisci]